MPPANAQQLRYRKLDVHVLFQYPPSMTNRPDTGVADLRAVGRDHLVHVIARVLNGSLRSAHRSTPMAGYDVAEKVADQLEQFGWQVFRPHVEACLPKKRE
jgi:hypothetical protein